MARCSFRARAVATAAGILVDRLLGEPPRLHPVAGFGSLMTAVERITYRDSRAAGMAHAAAGTTIGLAAGHSVERAGDGAGVAAAVAVATAGSMLGASARDVGAALAAGDLSEAAPAAADPGRP